MSGVDEWVTLRHAETGGTTSVPNTPDVIAAHEARGWKVTDEEPERPFVPPKPADDPDAAAGEWVDLVHPDLPGATNRMPNHPDALAGAFEAGWTYPEPPADEATPEPPAAATRSARRRAATDEPPAAAGEPAQDEQAAVSAAETKE